VGPHHFTESDGGLFLSILSGLAASGNFKKSILAKFPDRFDCRLLQHYRPKADMPIVLGDVRFRGEADLAMRPRDVAL
jgi:hypothetical protein